MLHKKSQNCPLDFSPSKRRLSKSHVQVTRMCFSIVLLLLVSVELAEGQVSIRERVVISSGKTSFVKPPKAVVSGVSSGFVVPKGLRNWLQVYYSDLFRFHDSMYISTRLNTILNRASGHDTAYFDPLRPEFPVLTTTPFTVPQGCLPDTATEFYYTPQFSNYVPYDIGRVSPFDTVISRYITRLWSHIGSGEDTLYISQSVPQTLGLDTIGWADTFMDPNICYGVANEQLDMTVFLNCAHYTRLGQDSSAWSSISYDSYKPHRKNKLTGLIDSSQTTIGQKGCALTCLTMLLTAYGVDTDPGRFEQFMSPRYIDSVKGDVNWRGLRELPANSIIQYWKPLGRGLDSSKVTVALSKLDPYLNACNPLIVQVANPPTTLNNHWVVVTGKNAQGKYTIADPGYRNRTTLDAYNNAIYAVRIFKVKP